MFQIKPSHRVCNPAYLMPVPSQDKLGGLRQEGIRCKNGGDDRGEGADSPDGVASSWIVGASVSVIIPLYHILMSG